MGRARIDEATRNRLGVEAGGFVEIAGKRTTVATPLGLAPEDEGKGLVRIDGLVRRNLGVGLGDKVGVRKAEVVRGERIILAPIISKSHKISFGQGIENFIKRGLRNRVLTKGEVVIVPGIALMDGALPFKVIETKPESKAQLVEETVISLRETPAFDSEGLGPEELLIAFVDRLSDVIDEFAGELSKLGGETGERARSTIKKLLEITHELRGKKP